MESEDKSRIVRVDTQSADGFASRVKLALNKQGCPDRSFVQQYIKECQWRHNNNTDDPFLSFLRDWGYVETLLRKADLDLKKFDSICDWSWEEYETLPEVIPLWACPGCDFTIESDDWKTQRKEHKKSCRYYAIQNAREYLHKDSRCICCVLPFHSNSKNKKRKATKNESKKKKKRKKNTKPSLWTCPSCSRRVADTASSRWLHRQSFQNCKIYYESYGYSYGH